MPLYFDASGNPIYTTRISTVGSASATDSAANTQNWASVSGHGQEDEYSEADKMSMDTNYRDLDERDRYSAMDVSEEGDGMSEEGNASLVGFGEGAGSTVSGPTYTRSRASQILSAGNLSPTNTTTGSTTLSAPEQLKDARMTDGIADDTSSGFADTTTRSSGPSKGRERYDGGEGKSISTLEEVGLGKFHIEERGR